MTCEAPSTNTLKEAEEIAECLGEAISHGDTTEALRLAERLCQLSVPVTVGVKGQAYPQHTVRLKVGVEDAQSENCIPVTVNVSPKLTIAQLKDKIKNDFGFHPSLQQWVIGKRLAQDRDTLWGHGVRQDGDQAFLFILSAKAANLTHRQQLVEEEEQRIAGIMDSMELVPRGLGRRPSPPSLAAQTSAHLPFKAPKPAPPPKPKLGWTCEMCTFVNKPTRPGCEICCADRPAAYQVPDIYQPDAEEKRRLEQEELSRLQYEQVQRQERERNFMSLLETDNQNLVPNHEEVTCPVCFCPIEPGEGATLRECLHCFCRECLKGTILNSPDAEVSCPFTDDIYSCGGKILDREISAVLSVEELRRFLDLRLRIAESRSDHSFHCKTSNCPGWCVYEDDVDLFLCSVCGKTNCILCKAIHEDMDCKQYQDDLRIRSENDLAARQTKEMLEGLLQSGEAMLCPRCDLIVQKKDGCDWLCCLMCKTEICWVTKQARWGPNGNGDTSGGCKCRVNNQLCHPNCQNCH